MQTKTLHAICAIDINYAMGLENELLSKDDLWHFKETTVGHTVVSGRRTFESMGSKALPKRKNIVITSNPDNMQAVENVTYMTLGMLDEYVKKLTDEHETIFFIGGSKLFEHVFKNYNISTFFLTVFNFLAYKADVWLCDEAIHFWHSNENHSTIDNRENYNIFRIHSSPNAKVVK